MRAGLVIAPHPRADPERPRRYGLGHPMAAAPRLQPRRPLFQGQTPERVGRNFHLVRPTDRPAPFADSDLGKQLIIGAQRRKDGEASDMLRQIDQALVAALPGHSDGATAHSLNRADIRGFANHVHTRRLSRNHSSRSNSILSRAQAIAWPARRVLPARTANVSISTITRKPRPSMWKCGGI